MLADVRFGPEADIRDANICSWAGRKNFP